MPRPIHLRRPLAHVPALVADARACTAAIPPYFVTSSPRRPTTIIPEAPRMASHKRAKKAVKAATKTSKD